MLQIINAKFCRLMESNGTQMPGDLDSARMRRVNRCL